MLTVLLTGNGLSCSLQVKREKKESKEGQEMSIIKTNTERNSEFFSP